MLADVDFLDLVAPLENDCEQGAAVAGSLMDYVTTGFGEPKAGEYSNYLHQAAVYRGGLGTWRVEEPQKLIDDQTLDATLLEQRCCVSRPANHRLMSRLPSCSNRATASSRAAKRLELA